MNTNINALRKDVLIMKIKVGDKDIDFTYDNLYISDESKETCRKSEDNNKGRKISQRPFIDRYRKYSSSWLSDLCYEDVVHFFFDENEFFNEPSFFLPASDSETTDDRVINENIYMTLYYLFPTGFPTLMNIRFSYDILSDSQSFTPMSSGYFLYDVGKNTLPEDKKNARMKESNEKFGNVVNLFGNLFNYPYARYSYLGSKSNADYTISQVTWKSDIFNHPQYVEFLQKVYSLCIWQRTKGLSEVNRLLNGLRERFDKISSTILETDIKEKIKKTKQLIDGQGKINEKNEKNKIENIEKLNNKLKELQSDNKFIKRKHIEHDNLLKLVDVLENKELKDEDFFKEILQFYRDGKVRLEIDEMFKGYGSNSRDSDVQSTKNNFIETFIQYCIYILLKESIVELRMIRMTEFITDKEFMKNFKDQEKKSLKPLFEMREAYFKFANEVGESTNDKLNEMIIDYMTANDSELNSSRDLGYCAIYYHNFLLKNQNKNFNGDMQQIQYRMKDIKRLGKLFTGINKDVSTLTNTNVLGSTSPFASSSIKAKTEYTIYLSMNVYDEMLDNVNINILRCYLLSLELGRRLNNLVFNKSQSAENRYLVMSEVKHIPKMTEKEVKKLANELETPKLTAPVNITQKGGIKKKQKNRNSKNKQSKNKTRKQRNEPLVPFFFWPK